MYVLAFCTLFFKEHFWEQPIASCGKYLGAISLALLLAKAHA